MEHETDTFEACPICLEDLSDQQLGVCLGCNGRRVCPHYFHLSCLRRVEGAHCPQCRSRFSRRAALPNIHCDPASWGPLVSLGGHDGLSRRDVSTALKAMLQMSSAEVDQCIETKWDDWCEGEKDGLLHSKDSLERLAESIADYMPVARAASPSKSNGTLGTDFSVHEKGVHLSSERGMKHHDGNLEDGHSRSGVVCRCGQIHVRRGDRVRRGPSPPIEIEKGDDDPWIPTTGQLGTIVRIGPGQECVMVKWDRSPEAKVHVYTWPDPEGHVVAPTAYLDLAEDVLKLQEETYLSSVAAEELLRRMDYDLERANEAFELCGSELNEHTLRKTPELYHRVRILPDSILVQEWFDAVPACRCTRAECRGGVQWNSSADRHLGREGLVLKIDDNDDTVLIETSGPCTCRIWYPRLAVEPVYNPDLDDELLFAVNSRVECRMEGGWLPGVVNEVFWHGLERHGPCPYTVTLDSGGEIFVPSTGLIRAAQGA